MIRADSHVPNDTPALLERKPQDKLVIPWSLTGWAPPSGVHGLAPRGPSRARGAGGFGRAVSGRGRPVKPNTNTQFWTWWTGRSAVRTVTRFIACTVMFAFAVIATHTCWVHTVSASSNRAWTLLSTGFMIMGVVCALCLMVICTSRTGVLVGPWARAQAARGGVLRKERRRRCFT